jgi:UV DNA damage endonuclease
MPFIGVCMRMKIGYPCINTTLAGKEIQVNRSMIKKTFASKGISYASELAFKNVKDLEKIIDWNIQQHLLLYRMSSDMFPWMSEYELADLPDYFQITGILKRIGEKVRAYNLRLTYHPGPFNVLGSPSEVVVTNTVKELRQHGEIMDLIGLPRSPFSKINIHIGGAYGDRSSAIQRFIKNFRRLPAAASSRLTVENDDKGNMFSIGDLLKVHEETGIPLVFDYHHHQFRTGDLTSREAMLLAFATWPKQITPIVHYSSSRKKYEDPGSPASAHADFIYEPINLHGRDVDVMLEAKAKEMAAFQFINQHLPRTASLLISQ